MSSEYALNVCVCRAYRAYRAYRGIERIERIERIECIALSLERGGGGIRVAGVRRFSG